MWHYFDPSSIYNPTYEKLRSAVSELLADSQTSSLDPKVFVYSMYAACKYDLYILYSRHYILDKQSHLYLLYTNEFVKAMSVVSHPNVV